MTAKVDLLTLQLFVAIVEEQSIAKAAEKRNIAASAVSRRISDIEDRFQVELLHRHSKGIEPTPAGFALLEHARIILGNLSRLENELTGYRQGKWHGSSGARRSNRPALEDSSPSPDPLSGL